MNTDQFLFQRIPTFRTLGAFFAAALLSGGVAKAQCPDLYCEPRPMTCGNIIKNPSFEVISMVPACRGHIERACCWMNLALTADFPDVDLYHTGFVQTGPNADCPYSGVVFDFSPPTAKYVNQPFISGSPFGPQQAYAGFFTYEYSNASSPIGGTYREYFYQELLEPIENMETVTLSLSYSLAEISKLATSFDVAFTANVPTSMSIPAGNKITVPPDTNVTAWKSFTYTWTNTTGATVNYITIGNFKDNTTTLAGAVTGITPGLPYGGFPTTTACYYVIDDISVAFLRNGCCDADESFTYNLDVSGFPMPILLSSIVGSISAGESVFIDGNLSVDMDYTFNNNDVRFSPTSKVTVQNNRTLSLTQGTVFHGCDKMWQGIDATAPGAKIAVTTLSSIQDAITAIVSQNGNRVTLTDANLMNNYRGVHLKSFAGVWPLTVSNTRIQRSGVLKPPYAGLSPHTGMLIENVYEAEIVSPVGVGSNRFVAMNNGIIARNSSIKVSNAIFQVIKPYDGGTNSWGIYSENLGTGLFKTVVNNSAGDVRFTGCYNGIGIYNTHRTEIDNTIFTSTENKAIWHQNVLPYTGVTTPQISVTNNRVQNAFMGVGTYNCGSTTTLISGNTINNTSPIANSRGISIENPSNTLIGDCPSYKINIENNTVQRHARGIYEAFVACSRIFGNTVNLLAPSSAQHHGIWVESSLGAETSGNTVTGNYKDWQCIGIRYFKTPKSIISCNTVSTVGYGFWVDANCELSHFHHNRTDNYLVGVYLLNQARLGPQYVTGAAAKNEWQKMGTGDREFDVDGSVVGSASPFYFRTGDANAWSKVDNINGLDNGVPFVTSPVGYSSPRLILTMTSTALPERDIYCNGRSARISGIEVSEKLAQGLPRPEFSSVYEEEHRLMYDSDMLRMLRDNPVPVTAAVQRYLDSLAESEVGSLYEVDRFIARGEYSRAVSANGSVPASGTYTTLLREINGLLLPAWEKAKRNEMPLLDEKALARVYVIANMCRDRYADAVLKARIFIRNHVDANYVFKEDCTPQSQTDTETSADMQVYPVPADDVLYVRFKQTGTGIVTVFDIQGKTVARVNYSGDRLTIPVGDWAPGLYVLKADSDAGSSRTSRVVIAR